MRDQGPQRGMGRRRYVRMPEDREIEDLRRSWLDVTDRWTVGRLLLVICNTQYGYVVRRWRRSWVAVLYAYRLEERHWPSAVSGWGATPSDAIAELVFRWTVLMRSTFDPDLHVVSVRVAAARSLNTESPRGTRQRPRLVHQPRLPGAAQ